MIVRPFLYDIKRTITSKSVLILSAAILLTSLAIIPLTSITFSFFTGSTGPQVLYYRDSNAYHFLAFSSNEFGDPLSGATISISLSGPANYTETAATNSTGLAFITINAPEADYILTLKTSMRGSETSQTTPLPSTSQGQVQSLTYRVISPVVDKANASKRNVQTFYAGAYGAIPLDYGLYYKVMISFPPFFNGTFPRSEMTFIGNLTSYHQVFEPSIPAGLNQTASVFFQLFAPNGTAAAPATQFSIFELRPQQPPLVGSDLAAAFFSGVLGFFIPLVAIIGSYSSYGKDRLTGVLESVLARPVSRRGLALSRFLSTALAISIAAIASVGIVDLILNSATGAFLPQSFVLAIIAALVVEVAAFTGLVFLVSHLVKSTGALLGIMIGLFAILDFFWGLIILLVTSLMGGTLGSAVALQATILSYFANPAQFIQLVNIYTLQSSSGLPIDSSGYGLTLPALVADGVLWSILPFAAFLYLAVRRD